jgi:sec-independent protein translocase protein TatA
MNVLNTLLLLGPLGVQELLIILLIVVIIFGASKLPQLGKGLGEGIRNFKKGIKGEEGPAVLDNGQETEEKVQ